jgi:hypothetical protein
VTCWRLKDRCRRAIVDRLPGMTLTQSTANGLVVKRIIYIRARHRGSIASIDPDSILAVLPWLQQKLQVDIDEAWRQTPVFRRQDVTQSVCHATRGKHSRAGHKKHLRGWVTSPCPPQASVLQEGGYQQKGEDMVDLSS